MNLILLRREVMAVLDRQVIKKVISLTIWLTVALLSVIIIIPASFLATVLMHAADKLEDRI